MGSDLQIQESVPLAQYTTWKIGGPARYLVEAKTSAEIVEAVKIANARQWPVRLLGNGSNTLVADQGFNGLIVIARNDHMVWEGETVLAGAGVKLGQLIAAATQHGLGGLSWLLGVPGTVGGSIYGNAGAGMTEDYFGKHVEWVEAVTLAGESVHWLQSECGFAYRDSRFKHEPLIILQAKLRLLKIDPVIERKILAAKAAWKNKAQPLTLASAGCMFTNAKVDPSKLPEDLRSQLNPNGTISAWRLIQAVGLQGKQLGQMQISPVHASFMINLGGGTADQAVQLISLVKQQVRDKMGIQLQEEIQYLGF